MPAVLSWRLSCSNSTSSEAPAKSGMAKYHSAWNTRPQSPRPIVRSSLLSSSRSSPAMKSRPPVTDWTHDFDHLDPQWLENPYPIWDEMRRTCPIAHTDRYLGV